MKKTKILVEDGNKPGKSASFYVFNKFAKRLAAGDILVFGDEGPPDWLVGPGENFDELTDWACTISHRVYYNDRMHIEAFFS